MEEFVEEGRQFWFSGGAEPGALEEVFYAIDLEEEGAEAVVGWKGGALDYVLEGPGYLLKGKT